MSFAEQIIDNVPIIFIYVVLILFICLSISGIALTWSMTMLALEPGMSKVSSILKNIQYFQVVILEMHTRWIAHRRSGMDAERDHSRKEHGKYQSNNSRQHTESIAKNKSYPEFLGTPLPRKTEGQNGISASISTDAAVPTAAPPPTTEMKSSEK